ncbi:MAG TPA: rhodanese-like domain-containing protein [Thermoanaerobaculia bacterium]|nr:rhodanese-like domain-containing protein [Thermoanaerobaculia bacterium]
MNHQATSRHRIGAGASALLAALLLVGCSAEGGEQARARGESSEGATKTSVAALSPESSAEAPEPGQSSSAPSPPVPAVSPKKAAAAPPMPGAPVEPRKITPQELHERMQREEVVIVDVRNAEQYEASRIEGAIHIPFTEMFARGDELPREKLIALYCSCPNEESSGSAALDLEAMGLERTVAILGGLEAWRLAGFPVTSDTR